MSLNAQTSDCFILDRGVTNLASCKYFVLQIRWQDALRKWWVIKDLNLGPTGLVKTKSLELLSYHGCNLMVYFTQLN